MEIMTLFYLMEEILIGGGGGVPPLRQSIEAILVKCMAKKVRYLNVIVVWHHN